MGLSDLVIGLSVLTLGWFFESKDQMYLIDLCFSQRRRGVCSLCIVYDPSRAAAETQGCVDSCAVPPPLPTPTPPSPPSQEVNLLRQTDKESECSWKFPLLHHWPESKQSAHSPPAQPFLSTDFPRACQVRALAVRVLFTLHICSDVLLVFHLAHFPREAVSS